VVGLGFFARDALGHALAGNVHLAARDRLDALFLRLAVEFDSAIERAMVSEGKRLHAQFSSAANQLRYAAQAIEERVFAVDVKVNESRHRSSPKLQVSKSQVASLGVL
jgi:hypothetical protein